MMKNKIMILFAMILLVMPLVYSIGMNPPRHSIDFNGTMSQEFYVNVLNNQKQDLDLKVMAKGELADYITLESESFRIFSNDKQKRFGYRVNLPEYIGPPGTYEAKIMFMPMKNNNSNEIKVVTGIINQLKVTVPREGKYLDANLIITNQNDNTEALFTIPISNKGTEDIDDIKANILIQDLSQDPLLTLVTQNKKLGVNQESKLSTKVSMTGLAVGLYNAKADVTFDGNNLEFEKEFRIGNQLLKIDSIDISDFELGDIGKITITYANIGNVLQKGVYSTIEIYKDDNPLRTLKGENNSLRMLKSENFDIESKEIKQIDIFWDTKGLKPSNYKLLIKTYYQDTSFTDQFDFELGKPKGVILDEKSSNNKFIFALIFMLIAGLLIISLIILILKKKKNKIEDSDDFNSKEENKIEKMDYANDEKKSND